MNRSRLSDDEIRRRLTEIEGFALENGKLVRHFVFPNFVEAFGWMTRVALHAEKLDHHPEWKNVFAKVDVELHTHDAGGVTALDFELARHMNELSRSA